MDSLFRVSVTALMIIALGGCGHPKGAEQAAPLTCPAGKQDSLFFDQVKRAIFAHWDPSTAVRRWEVSSKDLGPSIRYTVLNIRLDNEGLVRDVQVKKDCGVWYLNSLAVEAVWASSPLPAPPAALLRDGVVNFDLGLCVEFPNAQMTDGTRQ
ncbi:MAG: TonB C-terminal domain-containing protein [Myxococcaceae bacterium]